MRERVGEGCGGGERERTGESEGVLGVMVKSDDVRASVILINILFCRLKL